MCVLESEEERLMREAEEIKARWTENARRLAVHQHSKSSILFTQDLKLREAEVRFREEGEREIKQWKEESAREAERKIADVRADIEAQTQQCAAFQALAAARIQEIKGMMAEAADREARLREDAKRTEASIRAALKAAEAHKRKELESKVAQFAKERAKTTPASSR